MLSFSDFYTFGGIIDDYKRLCNQLYVDIYQHIIDNTVYRIHYMILSILISICVSMLRYGECKLAVQRQKDERVYL